LKSALKSLGSLLLQVRFERSALNLPLKALLFQKRVRLECRRFDVLLVLPRVFILMGLQDRLALSLNLG
jgi:hypothetical protein